MHPMVASIKRKQKRKLATNPRGQPKVVEPFDRCAQWAHRSNENGKKKIAANGPRGQPPAARPQKKSLRDFFCGFFFFLRAADAHAWPTARVAGAEGLDPPLRASTYPRSGFLGGSRWAGAPPASCQLVVFMDRPSTSQTPFATNKRRSIHKDN